MASFISFKALAILALAGLAFCVQTTLGAGIECENLNKGSCAFAVSSSGKRCVLERHVRRRSWEESYTCRASEIEADHNLKGLIETDQCVKACGLERTALGISSDALLESEFTRRLCSPQCYDNCPNVVDLYFNVAAGEGVFLPKLCEAQGENHRRAMAEITSSDFVAPGPELGASMNLVQSTMAPAMAPVYY